jgi:hypothetical protein
LAKSGLKHIDVGAELTKTEWESEDSHEVVHGTSFPASPVERQLFYRDDEHKWYIYSGSAWVWLGGGGGGVTDHGELTGLGDDDHPQYIKHSLATAVSDFLVASGAGVFVKKTLAEVKTLLNWAADIATHAGLTTGVHSFDKSCRLNNSAAQSIPNTTWTNLTFDHEEYDTDGMHSLVTNTDRITCVTAGKYLVLGFVYFAANATGNRQLLLLKNGGSTEIFSFEGNPTASSGCLTNVYCIIELAVGDYLQLQAYQNSGGALNSLSGHPTYPQFTVGRMP